MIQFAAATRPSASALVAAWGMVAITDAAWAVGLYNYDGEMGDMPPPALWSTVFTSAVVATVLVTAAWAAQRTIGRGALRFWQTLLGGFVLKGGLTAVLVMLSLRAFGPAPFTTASFYRGAVLAVGTALASGIVVSLIVRAIDKPKGADVTTVDH